MTKPANPIMYDEPIVNESKDRDRDEWLGKKLDQLLQSRLATLHPVDKPSEASVLLVKDVEKVIRDFVQFLTIDERQAAQTIEDKSRYIRKFLNATKGKNLLDTNLVRSYLSPYAGKETTIEHHLKAIKLFYRFLGQESYVSSFKFKMTPVNMKVVRKIEELRQFYGHLTNLRSKAVFLLLASSGLRLNEVMTIKPANLDRKMRMITPKAHQYVSSKNSRFSFYNSEAEKVLAEYEKENPTTDKIFDFGRQTLEIDFALASKASGIKAKPKDLRDYFSVAMAEALVPDRYVDAFQGRAKRSVLARHYTDYEPERMKAIYDKASIVVLGEQPN